MKQAIVKIFQNFKSLFCQKRKIYTLKEVFGCPEQPPQNCPTFLERRVHQEFQNALSSCNIIVVYGESRQGKTWTIERYCKNQIRIGCNSTMDIKQIKLDMLHAVNIDVREIEHSITEEYSSGASAYTQVGAELMATAGASSASAVALRETIKTTYPTIAFESTEEFLEAVKNGSNDGYFVFDNFHYLSPQVQQDFCSLLKEFNYRNIHIIIVGVWKESSKITAMAPDLINRCAHIDIGSWSSQELTEVLQLGKRALNIEITDEVVEMFKRCCASNIGIFKDYLQKFCQNNDVLETKTSRVILDDLDVAVNSANLVVKEAFSPLRDRLKNLATPQRTRRDSKQVRQKIVAAILRLIIRDDAQRTQNGLMVSELQAEIDSICESKGEALIQSSNVVQELGNLHIREENRQTSQNFIPLFYYDKTNRKVLVIEPTIYVIKEYSYSLLQDILDEILA